MIGSIAARASAALAFFVLLVAVVALQRRCGQNDLRFTNSLGTAIASIADADFDNLATTALAMRQNLGQRFAVMQVLRMTDHTDDDIGLRRGRYGHFVTVFIGLVILAFTYAVNIKLL